MILKKVYVAIIMIASISGMSVQNTSGQDNLHNSWAYLLNKYVSAEGVVNYEHMSFEKEKLIDYIKKLSAANVESMGKKEQLSFWINAYNALTVKLILDNSSVKSIKDIKQGELGPWDIKVILIGKSKYSLNEIENEVLRGKFNDPRIHFGIVCASYSCPKLLNKVYLAETVDRQLDMQAKAFVNDEKRNIITADKIQISKVFDWFKADFNKRGTIIEYLNKYSKIKINSGTRVEYLDYNWSLNNK